MNRRALHATAYDPEPHPLCCAPRHGLLAPAPAFVTCKRCRVKLEDMQMIRLLGEMIALVPR